MRQEVTKWWVGTFPSWIVVGLLGIISFFMVRTLDQVERRLTAFEATVPRITALESKTIYISENIIDIKDDIKDIKTDLKRVGRIQ